MEYIEATKEHAEQIYRLVQDTIQAIYPKFYPMEVVKFFCNHHSREQIVGDITNGYVGILLSDNKMVGTGSYKDNHITRVFVAPAFQKQGYGGHIMQCLEDKIALTYSSAYLDASLPSCQFYEGRNYKTVRHEKIEVGNGVFLVYGIMEKQFQHR